MDRNMLIIMALLIVIIALLVGLGASMLTHAKEDVKLTIMSNDTIYEGDNIEVKLTDLNDTPIVGEIVNITITDENGTVDSRSVSIGENGVGELTLNKSSGNYSVNCSFGGNENYTGNTTSKKITIMVHIEDNSESNSTSKSAESSKYGAYINDEWVSMSEEEYAERYPALYHLRTLDEGRYDQYHPEMYEVDREEGRI